MFLGQILSLTLIKQSLTRLSVCTLIITFFVGAFRGTELCRHQVPFTTTVNNGDFSFYIRALVNISGETNPRLVVAWLGGFGDRKQAVKLTS